MIERYVLLVRGGDEDPDGRCMFITSYFEDFPTAEDIGEAQEALACGFEDAFGERPERSGAGVLPNFTTIKSQVVV